MFVQGVDKMKAQYDQLRSETGVLFENLNSKIELLAEGHGILNEKIDRLDTRVDRIETRMDRMETRMDSMETRMGSMETDVAHLKTEMSVVKEYVISVDTKLNEHELIIKGSHKIG
jgi:predicted nuclease with TOPRIM domain